MSKHTFPVEVGMLDLAHDRVEFFLILGGIRIQGTSVFREVQPGDSRSQHAAAALREILQREITAGKRDLV